MTIIDADKFLVYLIYSKHIDGLTCGEVKKAIEMCKVDVLDKIRAEIWDLQYGDEEKSMTDEDRADAYNNAIRQVIEIIDKYKAESEDKG